MHTHTNARLAPGMPTTVLMEALTTRERARESSCTRAMPMESSVSQLCTGADKISHKYKNMQTLRQAEINIQTLSPALNMHYISSSGTVWLKIDPSAHVGNYEVWFYMDLYGFVLLDSHWPGLDKYWTSHFTL